jgi:hypothetical protein
MRTLDSGSAAHTANFNYCNRPYPTDPLNPNPNPHPNPNPPPLPAASCLSFLILLSLPFLLLLLRCPKVLLQPAACLQQLGVILAETEAHVAAGCAWADVEGADLQVGGGQASSLPARVTHTGTHGSIVQPSGHLWLLQHEGIPRAACAGVFLMLGCLLVSWPAVGRWPMCS